MNVSTRSPLRVTTRGTAGALWAAAAATLVTSLAWLSVLIGLVVWMSRDHQFAIALAVVRALAAAAVALAHQAGPAWFALALVGVGAFTLAVDRIRRDHQEVLHG